MANGSKNNRNSPGVNTSGLKPFPKPVTPAGTAKRQAVSPARSEPAQRSPAPWAPQKPQLVKPRRKKRDDMTRLITRAGVAASAVLAFMILIWALTNKNAYEVRVNDKTINYIRYNKSITAEALYNTAVKKLAENVGMTVKVTDTVTLERVHRSKKELVSLDSVESEIYKNFEFTVEGSLITANGIKMATLKSLQEAEEVKRRFIAKYLPEDTANIIRQDIAEPFEISSNYVTPDELATVDEVYAMLDVSVEEELTYTVVSGDNLNRISGRFNISLSEIKRLNPGVDENTILSVGRELKLLANRPILSVELTSEEKRTETKPAETVYRENPALDRSVSNVIQEGVDGVMEVTYHITSVNGVVTETKPVNTVATVPAVDEIIEVGTRQ